MKSPQMSPSALRAPRGDLPGESLKLVQQPGTGTARWALLGTVPPALVFYSLPSSEGEGHLPKFFWTFLLWQTKPAVVWRAVYQENMKPLQEQGS